ncbi:hypothetical protein SAMN05428949_3800 [Chitinophaga sp. YR627]|nr:hypothetical protein SAMN05428949_3800 [Chitinophaga sp. YR627]
MTLSKDVFDNVIFINNHLQWANKYSQNVVRHR